MSKTHSHEWVFGVVLVVFFVAITLIFNLWIHSEQQYVYLAQSFLSGKTYFLNINPVYLDDAVPFSDHFYWHMGPFPAVLLMAPVWLFGLFGKFFYQGYLQFFLTLGVFFLSYKISRKYCFGINESLYLSFAFCFASVYQQIAFIPWVWYFAQAVTVFLTMWAIHEYLNKKRLLLIGVLMAAVLATRFTAGLAIIFFLIMERKNVASLVKLTLPIMLIGVILLAYNFIRFGSVWDNGFKKSNEGILPEGYRYEQINYGLFQLRNIPTNIYYYFLKTVDPVRINIETMHGTSYILQSPYVKVNFPGTSFFVVSPIFLYIFRSKLKGLARYALIASLPIIFLLMTYYWPGWRQVGPRYMLDLLPLLYLVLLSSFPKNILPNFTKGLIIFSAFFNLYLLSTVF